MKNKNLIEIFDSHVEKRLLDAGCDFAVLKEKGSSLGAAVSGGADSVSLLVSLAHVCKKYSLPLKVVTVNHNIRSEEESGGDAEYVKTLGKSLRTPGYEVSVFQRDIKPGEVFSVSEKRGNGVEEAARFLRYEIFKSFVKEENCAFLALAHNKNDQIETVLMRFLQGSGTWANSGISFVRDFYVRPLLDVTREEIEAYLAAQDILWRTDSTNSDNKYLRNRIRNLLVPFLNENFNGFDKALLRGSEKSRFDEEFISSFIKKDFWELKGNPASSVFCKKSDFFALPVALRLRYVYMALEMLRGSERVSYSVIKSFCELDAPGASGEVFKVECADFDFSVDKQRIEIKKKEIIATESYFFAIIEESRQFSIGSIYADAEVFDGSCWFTLSSEKGSVELKDIEVPFCIRSRVPGDSVRTSDGGEKSVSDVLSSWHVGLEEKNAVPVLQDLKGKNQEIFAVLGSLLGYPDWIVK